MTPDTQEKPLVGEARRRAMVTRQMAGAGGDAPPAPAPAATNGNGNSGRVGPSTVGKLKEKTCPDPCGVVFQPTGPRQTYHSSDPEKCPARKKANEEAKQRRRDAADAKQPARRAAAANGKPDEGKPDEGKAAASKAVQGKPPRGTARRRKKAHSGRSAKKAAPKAARPAARPPVPPLPALGFIDRLAAECSQELEALDAQAAPLREQLADIEKNRERIIAAQKVLTDKRGVRASA